MKARTGCIAPDILLVGLSLERMQSSPRPPRKTAFFPKQKRKKWKKHSVCPSASACDMVPLPRHAALRAGHPPTPHSCWVQQVGTDYATWTQKFRVPHTLMGEARGRPHHLTTFFLPFPPLPFQFFQADTTVMGTESRYTHINSWSRGLG